MKDFNLSSHRLKYLGTAFSLKMWQICDYYICKDCKAVIRGVVRKTNSVAA